MLPAQLGELIEIALNPLPPEIQRLVLLLLRGHQYEWEYHALVNTLLRNRSLLHAVQIHHYKYAEVVTSIEFLLLYESFLACNGTQYKLEAPTFWVESILFRHVLGLSKVINCGDEAS